MKCLAIPDRLSLPVLCTQAQNGGKACGTSYPAPPLSLEDTLLQMRLRFHTNLLQEIEPCEDYLALSARNDCK